MISLRIVVFISVLVGFSAAPCGATVYHSNGSAADVQQIHDTLAQSGDIITLPAGTFSWTSYVSLSRAVTLQGQSTCDSVTGTCQDRTVIVDNIPRSLNKGLINIMANGGQRITGLSFYPGLTETLYNGAIRLEHGTVPVRIDHCHFHGMHVAPQIGWYDYNWGVIDHNVMDVQYGSEGFVHAHMGAGSGDWGDSTYRLPAGYGGPNFLFIEDNYLMGGTDNSRGGKICARHNIVIHNNFGNHGLARTYSQARGGRAYEIYNNEFRNPQYSDLTGPDSGTAIWHDNIVHGQVNGIDMQVYRCYYSFGAPFYGADGANPWDYNVTEPDGTHVDGHPPYLFESGTFTSGLTDTSKNWTTNRWAGYSLRRVSDGATAIITGNNATTLTVAQAYDQHWTGGDHYEIHKIIRAMDQPGLGAGNAIDRSHPAWPNPVSEPCYSWNNVQDGGGHVNFIRAGGGISIVQNRDYFNDTPMPGYTSYTYPHPLVSGGRALVADFNGDGSPDLVVYRVGTGQTAICYLDNNVCTGAAWGPTLPGDWGLAAAADFNLDTYPDLALLNPVVTQQTVIVYFSGPTPIGAAWTPTLPHGWTLVAAADFNGDSHPDYVIYNMVTSQTVIGYLNNNVLIGAAFGPTLEPGWSLAGVSDFDGDGQMDYALFNPFTAQTVIWYLSGPTLVRTDAGPTIPGGWALVAVADFNQDGKPDYLLYKPSTRETAIWYLDNNVYLSSAPGPTLPAGWSLVGP